MSSPTAQNLEAIQKALDSHRQNCGAEVTAIVMNPFEVDRLGFDDFVGIPIKGDVNMGTGRVRILCEGQHPKEPEPVEAQEPRRIEIGAPV